jgi:hypothetical protein
MAVFDEDFLDTLIDVHWKTGGGGGTPGSQTVYIIVNTAAEGSGTIVVKGKTLPYGSMNLNTSEFSPSPLYPNVGPYTIPFPDPNPFGYFQGPAFGPAQTGFTAVVNWTTNGAALEYFLGGYYQSKTIADAIIAQSNNSGRTLVVQPFIIS